MTFCTLFGGRYIKTDYGNRSYIFVFLFLNKHAPLINSRTIDKVRYLMKFITKNLSEEKFWDKIDIVNIPDLSLVSHKNPEYLS